MPKVRKLSAEQKLSLRITFACKSLSELILKISKKRQIWKFCVYWIILWNPEVLCTYINTRHSLLTKGFLVNICKVNCEKGLDKWKR